jgi:hypothetical protein
MLRPARPRRPLLGVLAAASGLAACGDERAVTSSAGAPPSGAWSVAELVRRERFVPREIWTHVPRPILLDDQVGVLLEPDFEQTRPWKEHPAGHFVLKTNNMGFLSSRPTARAKSELRILVLGDSHLVIVSPDESFPHLLEVELRRSGYPACEVLNSGIGYTGPRLYLRRLERYLELEPDVVLVSFFTGNDFWDDLVLEYDLTRSRSPVQDQAAYAQRLRLSQERSSGALFQGLNQAHWFKHWPGTAELALEFALASLESIRALCEEKGILLVVLVLPSKVDVDVEDEPRARAAALATLELTEEEAAVNVRLGRRLVQALTERGVACVDPTGAMLASPVAFYWRKDHHLDVDGHAFVAQAVFTVLEPLLASRGWKRGG